MPNHSRPILTELELKGQSESWLLKLAMVLWEKDNPQSAIKSFPAIAGVKRSALSNYLAGRGSMGGAAWLRIQKAIRIPLYNMWLEANQ